MRNFVRVAVVAVLLTLTCSAQAQQPPYMPASWFAPSTFPVRPPLQGPDRRPREEQPPQELGSSDEFILKASYRDLVRPFGWP